MKKIFLSFTLLLFAVAGFSQPNKKAAPQAGKIIQQNKVVKVDSLITVSLPSTYQQKDTLGQHIYTANGMFGYMIVIDAPNDKNNTPLNKQKDLDKVFKDYIKKIQGQAPGSSALHARDTTVGTLKAKVFTLKSSDEGDNIQYINFTLIYTKDATYTFEYVYPGERQDLVKDEYKAFISSIKLSPELQRNDQYLSNASGMSSIAKIGIYGGGALVLAVVVLIILRRRNSLVVS